MENVPGLAMEKKINASRDKSNKEYLLEVIASLLALGYQVSITLVFASSFGDPQHRQRLVLLAAKEGYQLPSGPKQTHGSGEGMKPIVNVEDVLSDLVDVDPTCSGKIELANGKTVSGHFLEGTNMTKNDNDARLFADQPAKTIIKKNKCVHYSIDRYLTLLEYKRLMSFPDTHTLQGTRKEMRDQIGNAVPCRFAEAIGKSVMESYLRGTCAP